MQINKQAFINNIIHNSVICHNNGIAMIEVSDFSY